MPEHDGYGTTKQPVYGQPGMPITVGGPTGDYFVPGGWPSSRWVEYQVLAVTEAGAGVANVVINPARQPKAPDYTGGTTYNKDTAIPGEIYTVGNNLTAYPQTDWRRVTSSEKGLYIRIDTTAGACFVTVRFRPCILELIPGPATTVHPDHMHQMNIAREENVKKHLEQVGIPEYAHKGDTSRD